MSRENRLLFAVLMLLCAAGLPVRFAFGQSDGVQVTFQDRNVREVEPGGVLTAVARVSNAASAPQTLRPIVELPRGWGLVFPDQAFSLGSGEAASRFLSISVPSDALAGYYTVVYGVGDSLSNRVIASDSLSLQVLSRQNLTLSLVGAPAYTAAGRRFTATVEAFNQGNVPEEVFLSVVPEEGLEVTLDTERLVLEPFSSQTATVTVETPPGVALRSRYLVHVTGRTAAGEVLHARDALDVIPAVASLGEMRQWFPVQISTWAINDDGVFYPQVSAAGEKADFLQPNDNLAFLLRGPNRLGQTSLGEIDDYWVHYATPVYDVHLGDAYYTLSPLTETGIRGFGARGSTTLGKLNLGSFAHQTRYYSPAEQQLGAYATYDIRENASIGANYLGKAGRLDGQLVTLHSTLQPHANLQVEAEAGADLAQAEDNKAAALSVAGRIQRLGFNGRLFRVGDNYASNLRSAKYSSGSAFYQLTQRIALSGSYTEQWRNTFRNPAFLFAQHNRAIRVGGRYSGVFSAFYDRRAYYEGDDLTWRDESLQGDLRIPIGSFAPVARFQVGRRAYDASEPFTFFRYDLGAQFRRGTRQSLQVSFSHDLDRNASVDQRTQRFGINAGANVYFSERLRANLYVNHNWYKPQTSRFTNADLSIAYKLPRDHEIVFRGRLLHYGQGSDGLNQTFSLRYIMPLRVPLRANRSLAAVRGRVQDVTTGEGVENVLLYVGDTAAITDAEGQYAFIGLPPDEYYLQVDQTSLGVGRTTSRSFPAPVTLAGGESVNVDVGITEAASLRGRVLRYDFEAQQLLGQEQGAPVMTGGQRGVVVEAVSGEEIQRRMTDSEGRFVFNNLRPGSWTLRLTPESLPATHSPREDAISVSLQPHGSASVELSVSPRQRTVQIIGGGELSLSGDDTEPAEDPVYVVQPTDTSLMRVAINVYGDESLWPKIWLANQNQAPDPERLSAGMTLRIPAEAPLTPAEREALETYQARIEE